MDSNPRREVEQRAAGYGLLAFAIVAMAVVAPLLFMGDRALHGATWFRLVCMGIGFYAATFAPFQMIGWTRHYMLRRHCKKHGHQYGKLFCGVCDRRRPT